MHLPSADQLWHIPAAAALPMVPLFLLPTPLLEQDTSYLALSASILSFSYISKISPSSLIHTHIILFKYKFVNIYFKQLS